MSDEMNDMFRAMKDVSQEQRAANREASARALTDAGVKFVSKNEGAHLIVQIGRVVVDFWPGTGKWICRGGGRQGRGVFNMLKIRKGE